MGVLTVLRRALALVALCFSATLLASPYIEVGDSHLRNSLQLLADGGFLYGPMNTFPLSWAPIVRDIQQLDPNELNAAQYEAYIRIMSALEFNVQGAYQALKLSGRSAARSLNSYTNALHEEAGLSYAHEIQGEHVAVRINTQVRSDGEGGQSYSFDGSYIAAVFGNWGLSYDQLDMWWGPGEDQALLQSNNARPVQALRLKRLSNEPFQLPILSNLGYWSTTAYVGLSEGAGGLGRHYVAGARFSVTPWRALELGASYSGQWGGNEDVYAGAGTAMRNQYASVDFRFAGLGFAELGVAWLGSMALYGEYLQSQRDSSPNAFMLGADYRFAGGLFGSGVLGNGTLGSGFIELTSIGHIYDDVKDPAGYRRWGRAVGAAIDQNADGVALGYNQYDASGRGFELRLRAFELDGQNAWVREAYGLADLTVRRLSVGVMFQQPVGNSLVRVGLERWADAIRDRGQFGNVNANSDTNLYATWEFRW